jgi:hypothetical protein
MRRQPNWCSKSASLRNKHANPRPIGPYWCPDKKPAHAARSSESQMSGGAESNQRPRTSYEKQRFGTNKLDRLRCGATGAESKKPLQPAPALAFAPRSFFRGTRRGTPNQRLSACTEGNQHIKKAPLSQEKSGIEPQTMPSTCPHLTVERNRTTDNLRRQSSPQQSTLSCAPAGFSARMLQRP